MTFRRANVFTFMLCAGGVYCGGEARLRIVLYDATFEMGYECNLPEKKGPGRRYVADRSLLIGRAENTQARQNMRCFTLDSRRYLSQQKEGACKVEPFGNLAFFWDVTTAVPLPMVDLDRRVRLVGRSTPRRTSRDLCASSAAIVRLAPCDPEGGESSAHKNHRLPIPQKMKPTRPIQRPTTPAMLLLLEARRVK